MAILTKWLISLPAMNCWSSSCVVEWSGLSTTNAVGSSPSRSLGLLMTAASCTAKWDTNTASSSAGATWWLNSLMHANTYIHTYTRLTALFPGLPGQAGTRKVKPIWILLKQETVSGSGISWAICKSARRSRQITMPAPHHSVFTSRMPFLPPNQRCQST